MKDKLLKIIYFLDFSHSFGGAANSVLKQAMLMNRAGHDILVVIPTEKNGKCCPEYEKRCNRMGLKHYAFLYYDVFINMAYTDVIGILDQYQDVYDLLKAESADLIVSTQLNPVVELAAADLGIPHVMNIYQLEQEWFRIPWLNIYAHYHMCDSLLYSNVWKAGLGVQSTCIRNECDLISDKLPSVINDTVKIITIGISCERKNQIAVIKAIERLKNDGEKIEYDGYGYDAGPYADQCRAYVRDHSLEDVVRLQGFISNTSGVLMEADVLVCSSTEESFPLVITEAMAANVPVITTPVAGVPELLMDGINAYIADGFSDDNLYETICRFIRDYRVNRHKEIIEKAHVTWEKNHSPEAVCQKLLEFYSDTIIGTKALCKRCGKETLTMHFEKYLRNFNTKKHFLFHEEFTKKRIWYWYHIAKAIGRKRGKTAIWGAGYLGGVVKNIFDVLEDSDVIDFYIDTYRTGTHYGKDIKTPDSLIEADYIIVAVAVEKQREMIEKLEAGNKVWNESYFLLF